ncbi:Major outer membrane lipoprotein Lpp precursor [Candidatus Arsenophonus lipoptenae]|uniref:Major outer membrane lipoprotein Lpp n=1 Tax=Candidatus Arsenophonus lipoptenae TaxID=634113 RepID=A0A0X9VR02_9GAMM|nr:major outer membrane lipoprotein [Candidatus Arsenophonus lipoptenae]AMA64682.1 Major outer membrane lipoprotein Lpp precursor [Candidatus Arsenophonus lipoptenae]
MNRTKVVFSSIVLASSLLAGCSTSSQINKLFSDVQTLNGKVEQLSNDVQSLRTDIQMTNDEAIRANQRLDNQVRKYKK